MSRFLIVGDPHVQPSNIKESETLFSWILDLANTHEVQYLVLLGDLFHTHNVIRLEVLEFWRLMIPRLTSAVNVIAMVGNHDMSGDHNSKTHALSVFRDLVGFTVVEEPTVIEGMVFAPYIHDHDELIQKCNALSDQATTAWVHNTPDGSTFENGMYAPGGFNLSALNFKLVIGGHIHLKQEFDKMWLPGTARWLTASDANHEKGVWIADFEGGELKAREYFSSEDIVSPIVSFQWKEGDDQPEIKPGQRVKIELIGSSDWISKQKKKLTGKASISSKITDKTKPKNRKTGKSLLDFAETVYEGEHKTAVIAYMKEKKIV